MSQLFYSQKHRPVLPRILAVFCLFATKLQAQPTEIFTPDAFLEAVGRFHPVAQQALFLEKRADAALRGARGLFDPVLGSEFSKKSFNGKNYYSTSESFVRLPSWYGLEAAAGYTSARGINLNPEEKLPANGQAFVGLSISIWQGFLMDDRRAALAKAKNLAFLNENERRLAINDLFFEAGKTYWEWAYAASLRELRQRFVELSQKRFEGIREAALLGDRPMIDTLEAFIQVQERRAELFDGEAELQQAVQKMEVFLWKNDGQPQSLPATAAPVPVFWQNEGAVQMPSDLSGNPAFLQYDFKLRELEIDRRLKREKLRPKLELKYNLLADGTQFGATDGLAGYKYGIKFSYPILARSARADLSVADFKISETQLQKAQKAQELQQKRSFYQTELTNLDQQSRVMETILRGHRTLLEAEQDRFRLGESSIFLLNARESKLLESETKQLKLAAEKQKARLGQQWAAGALGLR